MFDDRPVRKDSTHAKRQTSQEEENEYQEMHTESLLQRVIYFWSTIRTNTGASRD